jgi:hypothetical protein
MNVPTASASFSAISLTFVSPIAASLPRTSGGSAAFPVSAKPTTGRKPDAITSRKRTPWAQGARACAEGDAASNATNAPSTNRF